MIISHWGAFLTLLCEFYNSLIVNETRPFRTQSWLRPIHISNTFNLLFFRVQKFELLSLALLGVPSMAEKFLEISDNLKQLCFDSADYVCLKFILLLNAGKLFPHDMIAFWNENFSGEVRNLNNKQHVHECSEQVKTIWTEIESENFSCSLSFGQVHQILLEYCQTCYPNVPVSTTFPLFCVMFMFMTHVMPMHMTSIRVQSMTVFVIIMRGSLLQVIWYHFSFTILY